MSRTWPAEQEIGGYFELELPVAGAEYYNIGLRLNTARNALCYYLNEKQITHVYMPVYICDDVIDALRANGNRITYYNITSDFEPIIEAEVALDAAFVYVNYFGLCSKVAKYVSSRFQNVIIDNSQAFFASPGNEAATLYSARKYFGVADGAYLLSTDLTGDGLEQDISHARYTHAMKRHELPATEAYEQFADNERHLGSIPVRKMSRLTRRVLGSIDYQRAKHRRRQNFEALHEALASHNELRIDYSDNTCPMVYPLLTESATLRQQLISEKIYVAQYWSGVGHRAEEHSFEQRLGKYLVALPVDQRYGGPQMSRIIESVKRNLKPAESKEGYYAV